jgi:hypothetical protein
MLQLIFHIKWLKRVTYPDSLQKQLNLPERDYLCNGLSVIDSLPEFITNSCSRFYGIVYSRNPLSLKVIKETKTSKFMVITALLTTLE